MLFHCEPRYPVMGLYYYYSPVTGYIHLQCKSIAHTLYYYYCPITGYIPLQLKSNGHLACSTVSNVCEGLGLEDMGSVHSVEYV